MNTTEYWLISAPGEKTCQQTFDKLNQVSGDGGGRGDGGGVYGGGDGELLMMMIRALHFFAFWATRRLFKLNGV